ncbi:MAG: 1-acyl-sn-glycerol-3-phosphate acyltransferase [Bacteroidota bacterium]|jgi:putative hemolysin
MEGKNENELPLLQVDIEAVLKHKFPKNHKFIPRFIVKWLYDFFHLDIINSVLLIYRNIRGGKFVEKVLQHMNITLNVHGLENLPTTGGVIVVANHPMGGLDAMCLLKAISDVRDDLKVIANEIVTHIPQIQEQCTGVNKLGKTNKEALKNVDKLYEAGGVIEVFPAGLCSRKVDGKIIDLEWQKSFITKALQYQLVILPVYIDGSNSNKFYTLAKIRRFFKIKFNLEMMLLPSELYKQMNMSVNLYFGKPIPHTRFSKNKAWAQAQELKEFVYTLAEDRNQIF